MTRGYRDEDDVDEGRQALEVRRAELLKMPLREMVELARSYARRGWLSEIARPKAVDLCDSFARTGDLTTAQRHALAGFVAYVDCEDV